LNEPLSLVSIFVVRPGESGPYLSPFWSPKIGNNGKLFGPFPGAAFILLSSDAALILLGMLALFTALSARGRAALGGIEPWIVSVVLVVVLFVHLLWLEGAADGLTPMLTRLRGAGMGEANTVAWLRVLGALAFGCTATPSYFPPCVNPYAPPSPTNDAGADGEVAPDSPGTAAPPSDRGTAETLGDGSITSLVAGLSTSSGMLIGARLAQGAAGAILSPSVFSITSVTFQEGSERNKALGVLGAISGAGAAFGVILGGVLTQYAGWEWIFIVNVPIGLGTLLFVPRVVRESRAEGLARHFDAVGAFSVTASLMLFVYALTRTNQVGWSSTETILEFIGSAALLVGFVVWEGRTRYALVPLRIFRRRTLTGANIIGFLLGTMIFGMFFLHEHREAAAGKFDAAGFVLSGGGLALLLYALGKGPRSGWDSAIVLSTAALGLAALAALRWRPAGALAVLIAVATLVVVADGVSTLGSVRIMARHQRRALEHALGQ